MAEFQPDRIFQVLRAYGVEYVVIGGMAGFLQGSPFPTVDVDITPRQDRDNLARLCAALTELQAQLRGEGQDPTPFAHDADSLAAVGVWNLTTIDGDLDIRLVPTGTTGYDDLRRDAVEVVLRGTPVLLASLADIVRSKAAAGRDKDRRALPVLRELLARETRAKAGRPAPQPPRDVGLDRGRLAVPEDFDEPLGDDELDAFGA